MYKIPVTPAWYIYIYIWSPITYHSHKIDCLIITFKYEIPMKHSNQKQSNTHDTKNQYHQHHPSMVIFVTYLYLSVLRILSTCFSYLYLIWILKIYTVANHCILYVLIRYTPNQYYCHPKKLYLSNQNTRKYSQMCVTKLSILHTRPNF